MGTSFLSDELQLSFQSVSQNINMAAAKCVHKGCGKIFTDPEEPCLYHPGPPEFHEGQKGRSTQHNFPQSVSTADRWRIAKKQCIHSHCSCKTCWGVGNEGAPAIGCA
jgi:hypothetical protein